MMKFTVHNNNDSNDIMVLFFNIFFIRMYSFFIQIANTIFFYFILFFWTIHSHILSFKFHPHGLIKKIRGDTIELFF